MCPHHEHGEHRHVEHDVRHAVVDAQHKVARDAQTRLQPPALKLQHQAPVHYAVKECKPEEVQHEHLCDTEV